MLRSTLNDEEPLQCVNTCKPLICMVAWGGIEPPTRGFSIPAIKCSPASIYSGTLYANQHVSRDELDADTALALIGMRLNGAQTPT